MSARVHPTAIVDPSAVLADGVEIGPYAIVGPGVSLGEGTTVMAHASVLRWTSLGAGNVVHPYATLGGDPQDLGYGGYESRLEIGDRNVFREGVTVSRGTKKEKCVTRIGSGCLLMACSHVGHDCVLGDSIILANNVLLAGHCHVEDRAILSGAAAVHHFTTIGRMSFTGGLSRITMDVPPFMLVEGHPARIAKVNVVGLKRAGLSDDRIRAVRRAYKELWRGEELVREKAVERLERQEGATEEVLYLAAFLRRQMQGAHGRAREGGRS